MRCFTALPMTLLHLFLTDFRAITYWCMLKQNSAAYGFACDELVPNRCYGSDAPLAVPHAPRIVASAVRPSKVYYDSKQLQSQRDILPLIDACSGEGRLCTCDVPACIRQLYDSTGDSLNHGL